MGKNPPENERFVFAAGFRFSSRLCGFVLEVGVAMETKSQYEATKTQREDCLCVVIESFPFSSEFLGGLVSLCWKSV
jgi:hypothetical protein